MNVPKRRRRHLTLAEIIALTFVVGGLAYIGILSYLAMQPHARRSELYSNLREIRTTERAFQAEYDHFVDCPLQPPVHFGKLPFGPIEGTGWEQIGWAPEERVTGSYEVSRATEMTFDCAAYRMSTKGELEAGAPEKIIYTCDQANQPSANWGRPYY